MRPFWRGFETKSASQVSFKRHVIVLYWDKENQSAKDAVSKYSTRHPTIRVKTILVKSGVRPGHKVDVLPTILLLKNGQEVDRLTGTPSQTELEQFFRKAGT